MGSKHLGRTPFTPVVAFFLVASVLGALLLQLDPSGFLWPHLLYMPPDATATGTALVYKHQYWRLLTPLFLHFGLVHIVFNGLLLWILGVAIELRRGSVHLLVLLLLCGLTSNVAQYWYTGYPLFGGLSGALFGLTGYIIVCNQFLKAPPIEVPPALLWMLVITMVIGFTGLLNYVFGGRVANLAHASGFMAGIMAGLVVVLCDYLCTRFPIALMRKRGRH